MEDYKLIAILQDILDVSVSEDVVFSDTFHVYYRGMRVGTIKKNTYLTHRDYRQHFFRIYGGYGISKAVLYFLKFIGIEKIIIVERRKDSERLLVSDIDQWFAHGHRYTFEKSPVGRDEQVILPVSYMRDMD